jgi:hypothetical protein
MGITIEALKDFVYLGSNQSTNAGEKNGSQRRILQESRVYFSLLPIMRSGVIHRQTNIRLYKMVIRPVISYASDRLTLARVRISSGCI